MQWMCFNRADLHTILNFTHHYSSYNLQVEHTFEAVKYLKWSECEDMKETGDMLGAPYSSEYGLYHVHQITVYPSGLQISLYHTVCLILSACPCYMLFICFICVLSAPRIPPDKRIFTTSHTPSCLFQEVDERSVIRPLILCVVVFIHFFCSYYIYYLTSTSFCGKHTATI